jgi:hypothetical protein
MPRKPDVWDAQEEQLLWESYKAIGGRWEQLRKILAEQGFRRANETIRLKCLKLLSKSEENTRKERQEREMTRLAVSKPWIRN